MRATECSSATAASPRICADSKPANRLVGRRSELPQHGREAGQNHQCERQQRGRRAARRSRPCDGVDWTQRQQRRRQLPVDARRHQFGTNSLKSTDYENWGTNEPDETNVNKDCVHLVAATGNWFTRGCDQSKAYICEGIAPPPMSPPVPPVPPAPPPSPPPPSPPPEAPPRPPIAPLSCDVMDTRQNTQVAFDLPRWCDEVRTSTPLGGCDAYYSQGTNGRVRLCYNPYHPTTSTETYCIATNNFLTCAFNPPSPPSPPRPPPAPPPSPPPPSPPPPPSVPPSVPPRPPLAPLSCDVMDTRQNTQVAFDFPRWCYNVRTSTSLGGCDGYYSQGPNGRVRLCYNPYHPATSTETYCLATDDFSTCDFHPPSPPSPPPSPPPPSPP